MECTAHLAPALLSPANAGAAARLGTFLIAGSMPTLAERRAIAKEREVELIKTAMYLHAKHDAFHAVQLDMAALGKSLVELVEAMAEPFSRMGHGEWKEDAGPHVQRLFEALAPAWNPLIKHGIPTLLLRGDPATEGVAIVKTPDLDAVTSVTRLPMTNPGGVPRVGAGYGLNCRLDFEGSLKGFIADVWSAKSWTQYDARPCNGFHVLLLSSSRSLSDATNFFFRFDPTITYPEIARHIPRLRDELAPDRASPHTSTTTACAPGARAARAGGSLADDESCPYSWDVIKPACVRLIKHLIADAWFGREDGSSVCRLAQLLRAGGAASMAARSAVGELPGASSSVTLRFTPYTLAVAVAKLEQALGELTPGDPLDFFELFQVSLVIQLFNQKAAMGLGTTAEDVGDVAAREVEKLVTLTSGMIATTAYNTTVGVSVSAFRIAPLMCAMDDEDAPPPDRFPPPATVERTPLPSQIDTYMRRLRHEQLRKLVVRAASQAPVDGGRRTFSEQLEAARVATRVENMATTITSGAGKTACLAAAAALEAVACGKERKSSRSSGVIGMGIVGSRPEPPRVIPALPLGAVPLVVIPVGLAPGSTDCFSMAGLPCTTSFACAVLNRVQRSIFGLYATRLSGYSPVLKAFAKQLSKLSRQKEPKLGDIVMLMRAFKDVLPQAARQSYRFELSTQLQPGQTVREEVMRQLEVLANGVSRPGMLAVASPVDVAHVAAASLATPAAAVAAHLMKPSSPACRRFRDACVRNIHYLSTGEHGKQIELVRTEKIPNAIGCLAVSMQKYAHIVNWELAHRAYRDMRVSPPPLVVRDLLAGSSVRVATVLVHSTHEKSSALTARAVELNISARLNSQGYKKLALVPGLTQPDIVDGSTFAMLLDAMPPAAIPTSGDINAASIMMAALTAAVHNLDTLAIGIDAVVPRTRQPERPTRHGHSVIPLLPHQCMVDSQLASLSSNDLVPCQRPVVYDDSLIAGFREADTVWSRRVVPAMGQTLANNLQQYGIPPGSAFARIAGVAAGGVLASDSVGTRFSTEVVVPGLNIATANGAQLVAGAAVEIGAALAARRSAARRAELGTPLEPETHDPRFSNPGSRKPPYQYRFGIREQYHRALADTDSESSSSEDDSEGAQRVSSSHGRAAAAGARGGRSGAGSLVAMLREYLPSSDSAPPSAVELAGVLPCLEADGSTRALNTSSNWGPASSALRRFNETAADWSERRSDIVARLSDLGAWCDRVRAGTARQQAACVVVQWVLERFLIQLQYLENKLRYAREEWATCRALEDQCMASTAATRRSEARLPGLLQAVDPIDALAAVARATFQSTRCGDTMVALVAAAGSLVPPLRSFLGGTSPDAVPGAALSVLFSNQAAFLSDVPLDTLASIARARQLDWIESAVAGDATTESDTSMSDGDGDGAGTQHCSPLRARQRPSRPIDAAGALDDVVAVHDAFDESQARFIAVGVAGHTRSKEEAHLRRQQTRKQALNAAAAVAGSKRKRIEAAGGDVTRVPKRRRRDDGDSDGSGGGSSSHEDDDSDGSGAGGAVGGEASESESDDDRGFRRKRPNQRKTRGALASRTAARGSASRRKAASSGAGRAAAKRGKGGRSSRGGLQRRVYAPGERPS